jgi:hypothetical protein
MSDKITYDPSKRYTWTPATEFTLTGEQFGLILNSLRGVISTPEAARVLLAAQANDSLEAVLAKAVESGAVVEAPEEQQQSNG